MIFFVCFTPLTFVWNSNSLSAIRRFARLRTSLNCSPKLFLRICASGDLSDGKNHIPPWIISSHFCGHTIFLKLTYRKTKKESLQMFWIMVQNRPQNGYPQYLIKQILLNLYSILFLESGIKNHKSPRLLNWQPFRLIIH